MKIYYGAGHGKNTPGKRSPDGEPEWNFNNEVALAFAKQMKKYQGVTVHRTDDPTGKTDVPLTERTNKANRANADFYISFHHNAYKNHWGDWTGVETYYYKTSTQGRQLAHVIQKALVKAYNLKDRGIKTNNLHITRETKMPAVLVEGGFMDSIIDIKKLRNKNVLQNAGKQIAKAIANHFQLTKAKNPPAKSQAGSTSKTLTVDGYLGPETIKALQRYFKTPVDGYLSKPSVVIKSLQRFLGTPVDGYISEPYSNMVAALQRRYNTPVDGKISRPSIVIKELQKRLNKGKL